jgi:hypothetical protein
MGGPASVADRRRWGRAGLFHRPVAPRFRHRGERTAKIRDEGVIVSRQNVAPPDHHHVHIRRRVLHGRFLNSRPKAALDPAALGSVADLLRHRQPVAKTQMVAVSAVTAQAALHRHPFGMKAAARSRRKEFPSFLQPSNHARAGAADPAQGGSGGQAPAPMSSASRNDLTATFRRHSRAKAVTALAHELAGLIGPLHGSSPVSITGASGARESDGEHPGNIVTKKRSAPAGGALSVAALMTEGGREVNDVRARVPLGVRREAMGRRSRDGDVR